MIKNALYFLKLFSFFKFVFKQSINKYRSSAQHSLITVAEDPKHDDVRKNGLWGGMMARAWGTEWYFGCKHPHSDLSCQDFR
ncbi:hypothetical protein MWU78_21350 [Arenibacter sp. F26102]|uniref:hypothetical protein n=1 Tax=Arenibacter sp. F26102 TaxID=2926416 RepID=UPI001FF304B4|nr:hypothetical protein [Arenibacter sp. F26102]MCK0148207.1 hypothetical protein [Arenibacter sp. F26102]